ncbi:MAG: ribonuclease Z, partial [Lachnospiraceae bacterium]|nr:ribonuclease Z [Lachnospiraceae bacterium]
MVDVTLLGTGGMMPLPYRWLTSLMIRYNGSSLLIDCGEGTQITMKQRGWSANPIDVICFTHYHADHISGLPGLLLDMANSDRTEPVTLIGPKGLERVVSGLRVIAPELPFEVKLLEFSGDGETFELFGYRLKSFKVNHSVTCYGYTFEIDRAGRFDKDAAVANNIPLEFWSRLQSGETIVSGDVTYEPSMVMGPDRKGIKVTYCTDTRPVPAITENAAGSDLCILEGMYGEAEDAPKALKKNHMTMQEAANVAAQAGVHELWLTHFSPSMGRAKK